MILLILVDMLDSDKTDISRVRASLGMSGLLSKDCHMQFKLSRASLRDCRVQSRTGTTPDGQIDVRGTYYK